MTMSPEDGTCWQKRAPYKHNYCICIVIKDIATRQGEIELLDGVGNTTIASAIVIKDIVSRQGEIELLDGVGTRRNNKNNLVTR